MKAHVGSAPQLTSNILGIVTHAYQNLFRIIQYTGNFWQKYELDKI